jgi:hypothetical protein
MSTVQPRICQQTGQTPLDTLLAMLQVKRPHGSVSEAAFIRHFLGPFGPHQDAFGNLWLRVGSDPGILWSSHTDTCHRSPGLQDIVCTDGIVRAADPRQSNCLGADDAAGIWLMTEMIAAQIPGLYVFHRGEERGGLGSAHFAEHNAGLLKGIGAAIAFDRRGNHSIITHQRGARCCSDAFALSLGDALSLGHQPDPTGSFTDTANYVDLIGECTNVSAGYDHEHTTNEMLDLRYLFRLRNAVLGADLSRLVLMRQPGEHEPAACDPWCMDDDAQHWSPRLRSICQIVRQHPEAVADFLELSGVTARDLQEYIGTDIPF